MDDSSELQEWKRKYENSEQSLQTLKKLSHKAISDYEDLQRKYDQNQKAYDELKHRLEDTEYQLQGLQRALEPACEEYKQLQDLYTIEQGCRSEAEKYASSITKQNKKLKRQSQMLLTTLSVQNIPLEKLDEISIADTDIVEDSRAEELDKKVEQLESHIETVNDRIVKIETERNEVLERELMLKRQLEQYQDALATSHATILEHERTITSYAKISEQACSEHEDLVAKYNQEKNLREAAEKFASEMSSQREAIVRESSVLLASAASDQKLMQSFMQIEELQKELNTVKDESQRRINELEETIENDMSKKRVEDLEERLELATEELTQRDSKIKDLEKWKQKLEKDYENLELELDQTKQRIPAIPPPPPPPPASLFAVFKPKFKKAKKAAAESGGGGGSNKPKNAEFSQALEEMMNRIKSGQALKPMAERRLRREPSLPDYQSKSKTSAMDELNELLKKKKRSSDDLDLPNPRSNRPSASNAAKSELELMREKIRGANNAGPISPNLSRISEEDASSSTVNGDEAPSSPDTPDKRTSTNL